MKYQELASQWRNLILEGAVAPGSQLPSFSEMYAQYGATQTTVERVYSLLAQEGLIVREHRRGVFVADRGRNKAKTGIIGLLFHGLPDFRWPYWIHLMEGMQQEVQDHEMQLLLIGNISSVKWEQIDGLVIMETWEKTEDGMACDIWNGAAPGWIPPGMPCSAMLTQVDGVRSVIVDDYQAARDMTRYLLSKGHRRIGYLSSLIEPLSLRRVEGYRDALRAAGIEPEPGWVHGIHIEVGEDHFLGGGRNSMLQWMKEDWFDQKCTALLTQNDETAIGVIQALRASGLDAPADLSVTGFDGAGGDKVFSPRLTTVEVPLEEMGRSAIRLVMQQLTSAPGIPSTLMLPTRIREGESVRAIVAE